MIRQIQQAGYRKRVATERQLSGFGGHAPSARTAEMERVSLGRSWPLKAPKGVLTFFTGGDGALAALRGSVSQKAVEYVSTFSSYYPEALARYTRKALRSGWLTDPNTLGAYANFAPGQTTRFAAYTWYEDPADPASRQEVRFGNAYFIGEQTSSEFYGFMNGAAETGRLAAESVLRQLGAI